MPNIPISAFTVPANTVGIGATGYSLTGSASASFMDLAGTWNTSGTPTAIKLNITDTASNAASLLMDLRVGGVSRFSISKLGNITGYEANLSIETSNSGYPVILNNGVLVYGSGGGFLVQLNTAAPLRFGSDLTLTRRGAANLRLGAADAAAPVAQTLSVQSVVAGTTNTAGTNFTFTGSQGTGTGAGGSLIFQVAPAGSSGSAQNALATALTIAGNGAITTAAVASGNSLTIAGNSFFNTNGTIFTVAGSNNVEINGNGTGIVALQGTAGVVRWGGDTILTRDAANTLALRNGTAAQRFNVYNTWTSSTNYETFKIDWITTANTVLVGTEKGSGGGNARALAFQTDGTTRLSFSADNSLAAFTSANLVTGSQIRVGNASRITNVSDGVIKITDSSEASFSRLQFGGTTSSFPALKRSSATLQARLADDSDFAPIQGKLTTETAYTAGTVVVTGYLTLYDSTGTAYRVPCLV